MEKRVLDSSVLMDVLHHRKEFFETLIYHASTDPKLAIREVEEVNDIYRTAYNCLCDYLDDVEALTGERMLSKDDKTLDWRRFTLMGQLLQRRAVA